MKPTLETRAYWKKLFPLTNPFTRDLLGVRAENRKWPSDIGRRLEIKQRALASRRFGARSQRIDERRWHDLARKEKTAHSDSLIFDPPRICLTRERNHGRQLGPLLPSAYFAAVSPRIAASSNCWAMEWPPSLATTTIEFPNTHPNPSTPWSPNKWFKYKLSTS